MEPVSNSKRWPSSPWEKNNWRVINMWTHKEGGTNCDATVMCSWIDMHVSTEPKPIEPTRKVKALRLLAVRVGCYLRWNLAAMEKGWVLLIRHGRVGESGFCVFLFLCTQLCHILFLIILNRSSSAAFLSPCNECCLWDKTKHPYLGHMGI